MHALREFYSDRYNIAINKILLYGAEIQGFVAGFMHYLQTQYYFMSLPEPVIENKSPQIHQILIFWMCGQIWMKASLPLGRMQFCDFLSPTIQGIVLPDSSGQGNSGFHGATQKGCLGQTDKTLGTTELLESVQPPKSFCPPEESYSGRDIGCFDEDYHLLGKDTATSFYPVQAWERLGGRVEEGETEEQRLLAMTRVVFADQYSSSHSPDQLG